MLCSRGRGVRTFYVTPDLRVRIKVSHIKEMEQIYQKGNGDSNAGDFYIHFRKRKLPSGDGLAWGLNAYLSFSVSVNWP